MKVYFDNAATTPLSPEVFAAMKPFFTEHFGNASSIHSFGRIAKSHIEKARKTIAGILNAAPAEIFFTSGGTEADNMALTGCIAARNIRHVISSPLEHHAVLHTLERLSQSSGIEVHFVGLREKGHIDINDLKSLLEKYPGSLVSLMHANNEIGNVLDIQEAAGLCSYYDSFFHSDTVQSISHFPFDLQKLKIFSIVGSAHKFHGPKGAGFIYINSDIQVPPLIVGGAQERNMRGGTENVAAIVGMARALEIAASERQEGDKWLSGLKKELKTRLLREIPGLEINGEDVDEEKSLCSILNVSLPDSEDNDMLLFNLDINNIAVSAGSACASGTNIGSHVLEAIGANPNKGAIRFSFSKYNTWDEINYVVEKLSLLYSRSR